MSFKEECQKVIIEGNSAAAKELAQRAIDEKKDINEVIENFSIAIRKVGDMFEEGDMFLPELARSADAMESAMTIFAPILDKGGKQRTLGKVVIGTIAGDIHDIGKTLVATMLSADGFEVVDLGADVPVKTFIDKAVEIDADIICISALLTTTMVGQKQLMDELKERKIRDKFKILIGGAPVTQNWTNEIGADGTAENAISAVKLARKVLGIQ
ncbi:MAG: dimethylamine corrinoid protein 3 [Asgard group archaeon]|nr:dimethylamine corrinoid protein 3 [Asgard group archaeon]